jgi:hypothetical protein
MAKVCAGIADTVFPVIAGHVISTEAARSQIQTFQTGTAAMRIPASAPITVGIGIKAVNQRTDIFAFGLGIHGKGHVLCQRQ